jgi:hypothetical protein
MNKLPWTLLLFVVALLWVPAFSAEPSAAWDGLIEVKAKRMDAAYLMPGADFRPYDKVIIDATQVAFHKDWMKNVNRATPGISRDLTEADAARIAAAARSNFGDLFAEAFRSGGYEVVTVPGSRVLRLTPAVINLYINAPDAMSAATTRTYTLEAGEATLVLEARDAVTGALLGRVLDRRETRGTGRLQLSSSVINLSDFRALIRRWAEICVTGLAELKAQSPLPDNLQPGQKL